MNTDIVVSSSSYYDISEASCCHHKCFRVKIVGKPRVSSLRLGILLGHVLDQVHHTAGIAPLLGSVGGFRVWATIPFVLLSISCFPLMANDLSLQFLNSSTDSLSYQHTTLTKVGSSIMPALESKVQEIGQVSKSVDTSASSV